MYDCQKCTVTLGKHVTGEANVTAMHVEKLISSGISQDDIGVISPYNLQVATVYYGKHICDCIIPIILYS